MPPANSLPTTTRCFMSQKTLPTDFRPWKRTQKFSTRFRSFTRRNAPEGSAGTILHLASRGPWPRELSASGTALIWTFSVEYEPLEGGKHIAERLRFGDCRSADVSVDRGAIPPL